MTATVDGLLDQLRRQDLSVPEPGRSLTIAETAERTGVSAHTLRYYERIGLLAVGRDAAGQRRYTADDFVRVVFLNRLRMTGMPIRELTRYVELVGAGPGTEPERLAMLLDQRARVIDQIAELQLALSTIDYKITTYGGLCGPT
jgi:DNA-binding transcriptional MerR regulator